MAGMKVAVIGWGSLIWQAGNLVILGDWNRGGPFLPVEFSRISGDGRLTLVLDDADGVAVGTRHAVSGRPNTEHAKEDLRLREGTSPLNIGFVDLPKGDRRSRISEVGMVVEDWAAANRYDAAIWTDLPPNFEERTGKAFSVGQAMMYLNGLPVAVRARALEYIEKAPPEVDTPLRRALDATIRRQK